LLLYKGQPLGRWTISPSSTAVRLTKKGPQADAIFYSTSPFETRRRASIAKSGVHDVSPPFGQDLYFDGFALLDSYRHIEDKAPFMQDLRISVRVKLPSIDSMIQRIMSYSEGGRVSTFESRTVRLQLRTWLTEMDQIALETTLLNLLLITSVPRNIPRGDDLVRYFVDRLTNLLNSISDSPEYEGAERKFGQLCVDFVADFPTIFPITGEQLWRFLRGENRIPSNKGRVDLYGTPSEIAAAISSETDKDWIVAKTLARLDLLEFRVKNLSSGETAFLMLYAALATALANLEERNNANPVFLLLDEGEMFLHPSWQRQYITNVLEFVSKFPKIAARTHVFISTHSLIVAADAPPNTLFDVRAGELRNGFGLGPSAVLSDVYHVERFAGTKAASLIDQLIEYLKNPAARSTDEVRELADVLADHELQRYVLQELDRRSGAIA